MELSSNPKSEIILSPEFAAEIEKSRAMIADADAKPAKRGRGRPKKDATAAAAAPTGAPQVEPMPVEAFPKETLKTVIGLPFSIAALQTNFPGWILTDPEAEAIAPSLNTLLAHYAPQVKGESLALVTFAGALFSVGFGKYVAYLDFRKRNLPTSSPGSEAPTGQTSNSTGSQPVGASLGAERVSNLPPLDLIPTVRVNS